MSETYNSRRVFEDGKSYRVWSLSGQASWSWLQRMGVQVSSTVWLKRKNRVRNTEILIIVLLWVSNFL